MMKQMNAGTATGAGALGILAAAVAVGMQSDDPSIVKVALVVAGTVATVYAVVQIVARRNG